MAGGFNTTAVELIIREQDPDTGAQIYQLTSFPAINDHIYCEVPYMDPTSRYMMFIRRHDSVGPVHLWRADLERNLVTKVAETDLGMRGYGVSPDQEDFYYINLMAGGAYQIVRTNITTLQEKRWTYDDGGPMPRTMGSVTPDGKYFINSAYLGEKRFGILRFNLETSEREVIWEQGADMCNAHPQLEPGKGEDLLIQHNRGAIVDDTGRHTLLVGEIGATLYLVDINGNNHRTLPVGKPYTGRCQGHQCWIGKTGEILFTVGGEHDDLIKNGNLMRIRPGDAAASAVAKGAYFDHPNASRDGRFFSVDTHPGADVVVGSVKTGKWRVLCHSLSTLSRPQYTHPHPYLSPDNKWVIFNSDRTGVPHVFAARIPDGFLEELEEA